MYAELLELSNRRPNVVTLTPTMSETSFKVFFKFSAKTISKTFDILLYSPFVTNLPFLS